MGGSKKDKSGEKANKELAKQQAELQRIEQQRLEQQRVQYEQERQMLLAKLAEEQRMQEQAQQQQQSLLQQQAAQQLASQNQLVSQLQQQYDLQANALGQQLDVYKGLAGQADKQQQYLNYLNTKATVDAQSEEEKVRNNLLMSVRDQAARQGVLQTMAGRRGSTFSPELVRGTQGGSISSYNLLR